VADAWNFAVMVGNHLDVQYKEDGSLLRGIGNHGTRGGSIRETFDKSDGSVSLHRLNLTYFSRNETLAVKILIVDPSKNCGWGRDNGRDNGDLVVSILEILHIRVLEVDFLRVLLGVLGHGSG